MALMLLFLMIWSHWILETEHFVSNDQTNIDRSIIADMNRRWPNGIVLYNIHPNASKLVLVIKESMDYIEKQTCVKFVQRTKGMPFSFVYIIASEKEECFSYVGRFPNTQTVMSLNTNKCNHGKYIKHELLHALGFTHEHTRPDRDTYVNISWSNIKETAYREFYRYVENKSDIIDCEKNSSIPKSSCTRDEAVTTDGFSYDYGSLMHYKETAFSKNGLKTMEPIQHVPDGIKIGKTQDLSYWDILKIRKAYNCSMCITLHRKKPCKFPFTYWGKTYHVCTDVASGAPWCATEVDEGTGEYTEYDYCEPSCIECGTSNHPSKSCNQTSVGTKGAAELGDYPWHAFIMVWTKVEVSCEGALLTKNHVLSAASCLKKYEKETLVVKVGSVDTTAFSFIVIIYGITDKTYHPDYNPSTHENDLVILGIGYGIYWNQNSIPVCLPQDSTNNYTDMPATYTGVDIPSTTGKTKLGFLITKIVSDSECKHSNNTICAKAYGTPSNGNWGSPLVAKVNGSCALIGIHSKQSEGGSVLNFTRVDRYLEWIKPNILYYFDVYQEYSFWESLNAEINEN